MLRFSPPTSLNNDLSKDGEILGKYFEAVNLACQSVLEVPYFWNEYAKDLFPQGNEKSFGRRARKTLAPRKRNGGVGAG